MDTDLLLILGLIILAVIAILGVKSKAGSQKDNQDRGVYKERLHGNLIPDSKVQTSTVVDSLKEFKLIVNPKLKEGYTEVYVQKELLAHFRKKFVHVVREFVLESKNGITIDFDFGNGKVGLEVKLAKSVFKSAEQHRMIGQIEDYKTKYDSDNLIIVMICEKEHLENRSVIHDIEDKLKSKGIRLICIEITNEKETKSAKGNRAALS